MDRERERVTARETDRETNRGTDGETYERGIEKR